MSQNWTPPPPPVGASGAAPSNYLVPAILVTLFCCLPGGVVAIIYATQVNSKTAAGDIAGAEAASKSAKMWVMISAGVGVALILIYIVAMFLFGGLAALGGR
ncbi:MAG: CD225/dispanin family protein [Pyrinomonadaceae bacterium]